MGSWEDVQTQHRETPMRSDIVDTFVCIHQRGPARTNRVDQRAGRLKIHLETHRNH